MGSRLATGIRGTRELFVVWKGRGVRLSSAEPFGVAPGDFAPSSPLMSRQCQAIIESSYQVARALADDVELCCFQFLPFGKGLIKRCRTSPDAFVQIALQLAHFRVGTPLGRVGAPSGVG